ncbi:MULTISPECIES: DUF2195 family protein [Brucella/Ochrobactrum group]|uniref:DUF2195 family protein n=1 Tax=Ochrobactrum teleogrylli TaxID=2479765 RepID=A0ABD5K4F2_9HYPH|nr:MULTISPECIES: DUF2195 family protein [Brucella/Ochrobactrum group]MBA8845748.1 hypothetical protein [Ochrobactrum sp. RH1CCR137]MBA8857469.1 hypothetical protein [Ochrobactrum sp. RH1CCR134]UXO86250.1 DUF2195 family protein [Brucella intermedia]
MISGSGQKLPETDEVIRISARRRWPLFRSFVVVFFCAISTVHAASSEAVKIDLQNGLSACVDLKAGQVRRQANIVSFDARFNLHRSIGMCGCMSALVNYTASVDVNGIRQKLQQGIISLAREGDRTVILASDQNLIAGKDVRVELSCAGPL